MLDAIAIIILAGMMLIPGINLLVGIVAGGASFGVSGAFAGAALAVLITLGEKWLSDGRRITQSTPTAAIISFPGASRWPVPVFEEDPVISAALSKLAATVGSDFARSDQDALAA